MHKLDWKAVKWQFGIKKFSVEVSQNEHIDFMKLKSEVITYQAGNIKIVKKVWSEITTDCNILSVAKHGIKIDFRNYLGRISLFLTLCLLQRC